MSDPLAKPRVRVQAASQRKNFMTGDSFQNFAADLGYGTNNLSSASTYGFNPISRIHTRLEWLYRGSWLVRKVVDCPANDMTRAGIDFTSAIAPDDVEVLHQQWAKLGIWNKVNKTIKWGRLYGGCIAVMMIEGQDLSTPLRMNTIPRGGFKGMLVLDRWMVTASTEEFITDAGPDFGMPMYYTTTTAGSVPQMRIHHSRCIRMEGDDIPYWQRIAENGWTVSVIEQLFDRLIAFDSASTGAAQLVYKAHLRTFKVNGLRELIAAGGTMYQAFLQNMALIRQMQTNEGLTIIDGEDDIQYHTNSAFSGLSDAMLQFGEQISGASGIPLVILFGQSPAGLNSTGESDIRNYYDRIAADQSSRLEQPLSRVAQVLYWSVKGAAPPSDFGITFNPLWQQTEKERADNANTISTAISNAFDKGIIDQATALAELKQSSHETGVFSNITDEAIAEAKLAPPPPPDMLGHNGGPPLDQEQPVTPPAPGAAAPAANPPASAGKLPSDSVKPPTDKAGGDEPPEGMMRVAGTPDHVHLHVAKDTPMRVNYNTHDDMGGYIPPRRPITRRTTDVWEEGLHPRADNGQFGSGDDRPASNFQDVGKLNSAGFMHMAGQKQLKHFPFPGDTKVAEVHKAVVDAIPELKKSGGEFKLNRLVQELSVGPDLYETKAIPLDKVVGTQPTIDSEKLAAVSASVKEGTGAGRTPIVALHNGHYYILDGHHRAEAAAENGKAEMTARVIKA